MQKLQSLIKWLIMHTNKLMRIFSKISKKINKNCKQKLIQLKKTKRYIIKCARKQNKQMFLSTKLVTKYKIMNLSKKNSRN